jgi:hypothetical protein
MVPQFMGKNISLGKITGRTKALFEFVIKAKVDINLFVGGAVERTGGRARGSPARSNSIAESHQFGAAVRNALLLENSRPGLLCVVQHERDKLHRGLFSCVAGTIRLRNS